MTAAKRSLHPSMIDPSVSLAGSNASDCDLSAPDVPRSERERQRAKLQRRQSLGGFFDARFPCGRDVRRAAAGAAYPAAVAVVVGSPLMERSQNVLIARFTARSNHAIGGKTESCAKSADIIRVGTSGPPE